LLSHITSKANSAAALHCCRDGLLSLNGAEQFLFHGQCANPLDLINTSETIAEDERVADAAHGIGSWRENRVRVEAKGRD
jgi:hypothetical protein